MLEHRVHFMLERGVCLENFFHFRWRHLLTVVPHIFVLGAILSILGAVRRLWAIHLRSLLSAAPRAELLRHSLVSRVIALPWLDLPTPVGHVHSIAEWRQKTTLLVGLDRTVVTCLGHLCCQVEIRLVCRCYLLRFYEQEVDQLVEIKVIRRSVLHLLASAVD